MTDYVCKIERLANGFEVEISDPKIVAQNNKRNDSKGYTPWKDPMVGYSFKSVAEVCAFLEKNLEKALPADEFGNSFDAAVSEDDGEDS